MDQKSSDDRELVRLARRGDYAAFDALVRRHQQQVFFLALRIVRHRHDAEEVVQQTFLSAVEGIADFREEASFGTWISRIALNHALAMLRKRSRRQTVSLNDALNDETYADLPHPEYIARWRATPDEIAQHRETQQLLADALNELDDKYRLVFLLRDIEGLSTEEAAQALGIGVSNVKVRLLRARLMLRERLTRIFGDQSTRVAPAHDHGPASNISRG